VGLRVDGAIQDRSKEHLGQSDKAISAYRRILRGAIEVAAGNGGRPPMVLDPAAAAGITGPPPLMASARAMTGRPIGGKPTDQARRQASSWAAAR
jgi:hypothetical protein